MKQTTLVDDRDGVSPADVTRNITVDGVRHTLDLSNANSEKLDKALKPWLDVATRATTKASTNGHSGVADVRAWAIENGFEVASMGRIPADVQKAYDEAHA